jgi:tRNA(fMet)-specific endonuclease VapC
MANSKLLIDTSIIIDHFRKKDKSNTRLVQLYKEYVLCVSSITAFELYNGASSPNLTRDINLILKNLEIINFNLQIAFEANMIYKQLLSENKVIEFRDIFIAATAIVYKLPIDTLNVKHFERIKGILLHSFDNQ